MTVNAPARRATPLLLILGVLIACTAAPLAHAASISFIAPANTILLGTPFQIEVHLETEQDAVNMVQGALVIPKGLRVLDVETGASPLRLWPTAPRYVPSSRSVVFFGGTPGTFAPGSDVLLYKVTLLAERDGTYTFSSGVTQAYRDDGLGTSISVPENTVSVRASGTALSAEQVAVPATPSPDLIPPTVTYADIGRDPALFGGAYYVSFSASDAESGIDHYEVKEGWFGSYTRTNQYYVLTDQSLDSPIVIRAADRAGNTATYVLGPKRVDAAFVLYALLGSVVFLGVILIILRKFRARSAY
jgi:hypothetical protein